MKNWVFQTHKKKPIRICMFIYYFPPYYSGAAFQALNLSKELLKHGIQPFFLTVDNSGLPEMEKYQGFDIYRVKDGEGRRASELVLWWNILRFLIRHRNQYDIICSHGAYYRNSIIGILGKLLNKKSLVKVSLASNDLKGLGEGLSGILHGFLIRMIDRYISISSQITREMMGLHLDKKKIEEIPNGVDTSRFSPVPQAEKLRLRQKLELPEGLMLLYVGGISQRKNVEWLVKSWTNFCPLNSDTFLTIVGPIGRQGKDEKLYNSLVEFVESNSLEKQIIFKTPTLHIEQYYQTADIFVLPSRNEGMPNVVLEAMSSGLPCLVNKVSGAEDIINGRNGLLFNVEEPDTFLSGVLKLKDQSTRIEMGKSTRKTMVRNFSLERIAERYIDLYEEMLK